MIYGVGTWATSKKVNKRVEVNEMRMFRWKCGADVFGEMEKKT